MNSVIAIRDHDSKQSNDKALLAGQVLIRVSGYISGAVNRPAGEYDLQMLDTFLQLFKSAWDSQDPERICSIEDFIIYLVMEYKNSGLATPDGVEKTLSRFHRDFAVALSMAQRLADRGLLSRAATA
jgi:hypothetical protein